jgi:hypothetical protein
LAESNGEHSPHTGHERRARAPGRRAATLSVRFCLGSQKPVGIQHVAGAGTDADRSGRCVVQCLCSADSADPREQTASWASSGAARSRAFSSSLVPICPARRILLEVRGARRTEGSLCGRGPTGRRRARIAHADDRQSLLFFCKTRFCSHLACRNDHAQDAFAASQPKIIDHQPWTTGLGSRTRKRHHYWRAVATSALRLFRW